MLDFRKIKRQIYELERKNKNGATLKDLIKGLKDWTKARENRIWEMVGLAWRSGEIDIKKNGEGFIVRVPTYDERMKKIKNIMNHKHKAENPEKQEGTKNNSINEDRIKIINQFLAFKKRMTYIKKILNYNDKN